MRTQRGMLLLEHAVAIVVMGLLVTGTFALLSIGYVAASMAEDLDVAVALAHRTLEEVRADRWQNILSVPRRPFDPPQPRGYQWQLDVVERATGLKEITVTVYWAARGREQHVTLATLVGGAR